MVFVYVGAIGQLLLIVLDRGKIEVFLIFHLYKNSINGAMVVHNDGITTPVVAVQEILDSSLLSLLLSKLLTMTFGYFSVISIFLDSNS